MLINVVNFLLFAHISFGIVRGVLPSLSPPLSFHSHCCAALPLSLSLIRTVEPLLFLVGLFNEKFMTWPFSGCASCWLFAAFI